MKAMKKTVIVIMIVVCVIFLINKITFAGIEEILMPDAKVIVKGKLPDGCTVNIDLILNDSELNTSRIDDFVVWSQPIGVCNSCCDNPIRCDCAPYPPSLEILLAISENGLFFFGCEATLPDVLSVIGTISAGGGDDVTLNNWRYDDCRFESKDIALVGMGYKIFKNLEGKGYISEIYPIESFRDSYSIEAKHKFDKNAIVIYYPTYIFRGSEHTTIENLYGIYTKNYGASFSVNEKWCPFFSTFDNGIVTRSCRINYQGEIASYVYCSSANNNVGEESWIRLDDIEIIRRIRYWMTTRKFYNNYPQKIELGAKKTWSDIKQLVTITVLADSVTASDWQENPSLGQRKNPPPDILALEPNTWYGEYIKYFSENPMVGKAVSFDASSSFDPDEITSYEWDFGDENTASGYKVDHVYSQPGEYYVTLTAYKNNGEVAKSSLTITIKDFQLSKLETIGVHVVGFDIGDVDNDNSDEVVSTDPINKRIIVYNDQYNLKYSFPFNESPRTVLISDIDDDGKNEIIVGTAAGAGYESSGYAYIGEVSNENFSLEWKSPAYCLKWADELAVGDLNSNGKKELIMGLAGDDDKVVSYEYTGSTYSLIFTENIGSDVDSVFIARDKLFVGTSCSSDYGMRVYNKYNMEFSDLNDGSTCVSAGDVNGDGKIEIVRAIGGKCEYVNDYYTTTGLVGKHSYPRPSFTIYDETYTKVFTSTELSVDSVPRHVFITTGELLPGGGEEIAVGIRSETHEIIDKIRVYRYNGTNYEEVWNDELSDVTNDVYHLKIADIDRDGQNELYVSTTYGLRIYRQACFTCYADNDEDGYGDPNSRMDACKAPNRYVLNGDDCNDQDPAINPGMTEVCNGVDDDCNDLIDEGLIRECSTVCGKGTETCKDGKWSDCDAPTIEQEICDDGKDNDCDGLIDEPDCSIVSQSVRVVDTQGNPGQIGVIVPIEVEGAVGIAGADIALSYDPDVLVAKEVRPGSLIDGFLIISNIDPNKGKMNIGIANSTGIEENRGTLVEIIFNVAESASVGTIVPLIFENLEANDKNAEPIDFISINGEFRIICDKTIYYKDHDKDGFGVTGNSRCLDTPDEAGGYTALIACDPDDNDPTVYCRTFRVLNTQGYPGQTQVKVPIEIEDAIGVAGLDITFNYDPNILIAQEVMPTSLINGFITLSNIVQSEGKIYWSASSSTGITSDNGILAEIIFDVSESAIVGTVSPLILDQVLVYNENVDSCGAITIDGEFLIVEKCLYGDLNEDQEITSADAIIILQIVVGLRYPDDYEACAADVNNDGDINSADAILVLKAAVKMPTIFHTKPKSALAGDIAHIIGWNFGNTQNDSVVFLGDIPADTLYWSDNEIFITIPSEVQPGQAHISIDIAGNFSNLYRFTIEQDQMTRHKIYYPRLKVTESTRIINVPLDLAAGPSEYVTIPIEIDDAAGIAGMDLVLGFDPDVLIPVDVERTSLTEGFLLGINDSGEGSLMVSMASATGITEGSGALVNLVFEVSPDAQESDSTGLTIQTVRLYDENAELMETTAFINGQIAVQGRGNSQSAQRGEGFEPYFYYPGYYPWPVSPLFPQGDLRPEWFNPVTSYYSKSHGYQYGVHNLSGWRDWIDLRISNLDVYYGFQHIYQWPAYYWLQHTYYWPESLGRTTSSLFGLYSPMLN